MSEVSPAMTVKEAAQFLNCARSYVFTLIYSGKVEFQRLGKHFVLRRASVEALLERGWRQNTSYRQSRGVS